MEVGLVRRIDIDDEMQQAYLDYAMSVIVARALPDARDGLKPVHRRILHAMHTMGIRPDSAFKKSARIVGEVLGKYHPHGDMAVYDAMVRMAQSFSMRYPLVAGQGNFGSVDGDSPAAMRYTEARLTPLAMEMLVDIDKDTVEFEANFDGSLQEPKVLSAAVPNLLVNGATGIAVGMSTSVPPHNMSEICSALIYLLENWKRLEAISLDNLMGFVKGPDFPTGGIILRDDKEGEGLVAAYGTGRGKITVQAKATLEAMGRGRSRIIVSELPFQTNKASLIEKIADLVREGKLEGITDLRDESDRQGMRIVIELSKNAEPEMVLSELYRRTPMQSTFSMILLALVDGQPRLLNLKQALRVYLEHRLEVVRRRAEFDLARAKERAHILEGLRIALKNLDAVIKAIRSARDVEQARKRLEKRFKLSEVQALAVLDMPLRRLASLERKAIEEEYKRLLKRIKELEGLLGSESKMRDLIANELAQIQESYGDRRRTLIVEARTRARRKALLTASDLAPEKDTWVVLTRENKIFRTHSARLPRLAGRSAPRLVIESNSLDWLYLFDAKGNGATLAVHTLPEADSPEEAVTISSISPFEPSTEVVTGLSVPKELRAGDAGPRYMLLATTAGMVKKIALESLPGPSAKSYPVMKVSKGDALGWSRLTNGEDEIVLVSRLGMGIRFSEQEVRPMGLAAAGVLGIRLTDSEDRVVGMDLARPKSYVFLLSDDGQAKRTALSKFPTQGRYGKGVLAWKSSDDIRLAGAFVGSEGNRAVAQLARAAARSIRVGAAVRRERNSSGKSLFPVNPKDRVAQLSPVIPRPREEPQPKPKATPTRPKKKPKAVKAKPPRPKKRSPAKKTKKSSRSASKVAGGAGRKSAGGSRRTGSGAAKKSTGIKGPKKKSSSGKKAPASKRKPSRKG